MLRFQATGTVEMHSPRDRRLVVILLPCRVRQILAGSGGIMTNIQQSLQLVRLCELASTEHDLQKLVRLILKINQELDEVMGESELSLPEAAD